MPKTHLLIDIDFRTGEISGNFNPDEVKWLEVADAMEAIVTKLKHRSLKPPAFIIFDSVRGIRCE